MPRSARLSIRMPDETREQLEATAQAHGETRSALMQVIRVVRNVETRGDRVIAEAVGWLGLSTAQVRIAVEYYADYPSEVDAWLAKVDAQAVEAEDFTVGVRGSVDHGQEEQSNQADRKA